MLTNRSNLNDNNWHHVACVHDATNKQLRIYVDGVLDGSASYTSLGNLANSSALYFGRRGASTSQWFGGQLDEVRIWKLGRSQADIQATMSQPLTGSEAGLLGYWPLDEGVSSAITDLAAGAHYGLIDGGAYWTENSAPVNFCATTDLQGNYVLANLRYGAETTFKVTPSQGVRRFEPAFKTITLSTGNPVQNEVGFIDVSSFTVSGFVKFREFAGLPHNCFVENVEILVDDVIAGTTDKNGKFAVSVELGDHTLKARLKDHTFDPAQIPLPVFSDISGINITDTQTRTLSGRISGGCNIDIGTATLEIFTDSGCLTTQIQASGNYRILLPPQKYFVRLKDIAPPAGLDKAAILKFFDNIGGREVDLTGANGTLDFIYRAPLLVNIEGLPATGCANLTLPGGAQIPAVPVLKQGEDTNVPLTIRVYENYGGGNLCPVDSGTVTIFDEISNQEGNPVVLTVKNGQAVYRTFASTPNLAAGRVDAQGNNRSFQKALSVVAEVKGQAPVTAIQWVIVQGHVAPEGSKFISATSTPLPLFVLRDPPGDGSYAFLEQGQSTCTTISYDIGATGGSSGLKFEGKFGIDKNFWIGVGAGTSVNVKGKAIVNESLTMGQTVTKDRRTQVCLSTTKNYSTSANPDFIGENGDVFIGAAMNYIFAEVGVIEIENCSVVQSKAVGFQPDGFNTTFAFTHQYIESTLIPELDALAAYYGGLGITDSAAIFIAYRDEWQKTLDANRDLKKTAKLKENRSFSAGADFQFSLTSDTTTAFSTTTTFFLDNELEVGFEGGADGTEKAVTVPSTIHHENVIGLDERSSGAALTVGYVLSDDDRGDDFTVDVKQDDRYPTPIFDVRAGRSSCPWEPWPDLQTGKARMIPRDGLNLSITPPVLLNVPPDKPAVFTLGLANLSPTGETRTYVLSLDNTSNPGGAIIKANGSPIHQGLSFSINPNTTQEITLSVERGPRRYIYNGLTLDAEPACEIGQEVEFAQSVGIAQSLQFNVSFKAPCSDITLFRPLPNWSFNQAEATSKANKLELILSDFELKISETDSIDAIGAEYRPAGTDVWLPVPGSRTTRRFLQAGVSKTVQWDVSSLLDGKYELRAFTECTAGKSYSAVAMGTIDRQPPLVFGTPQPADQVLALGDDISITFNEPIKCSSITAANVTLIDAGTPIAVKTVCNNQTIIIEPTAGFAGLEGKTLQVTVSGIQDLLGNPMAASRSWTFTVNRNAFTWSQLSLTQKAPFRNPGSFTAELVNGSPQAAAFTISTPSWLTPTPASGTLAINGRQQISFAIQPTLAIGNYTGTVTASASGLPNAQLNVNLEVLCVPPVWSVDASKFEHTMTIVAQVLINNAVTTDLNDRVAAYVGNQLRGAANIKYESTLNKYLAFLTVYSNISTGEKVRFQVWDNSECLLYDATQQSFTFTADNTIGTPNAPTSLNAILSGGSGQLQNISVAPGWTWFSMNITPTDFSTPGVLSDLTPATGDLIKSQTQFSQFDATAGWAGTLLELNNTSGYMIRLSNSGLLTIEGTAVNPSTTSIPVVDGWNWISYLPQAPIEVNAALANLKANDGDVIKSQYAFAQYVKQGGTTKWFGSMPNMQPGLGYRLRLAKANQTGGKFNYPVSGPAADISARSDGGESEAAEGMTAKSGANGIAKTAGQTQGRPNWSVNPNDYQFNMTVVAALKINGTESRDTNDMIAAFVDGVCRGVAQPQFIDALNRYEAFLMIHSNQTAGETVVFKAFDADAEVELKVGESIAFEVDASRGTVAAPVIFNAEVTTSVDEAEELPKDFGLEQNYPNPFNPETTIRFALPRPGHATLSIYNITGQLVRKFAPGEMSAGRHVINWDGRDQSGHVVAAGVYLYRLLVTGENGEAVFTQTRRMALVK